MIAEAFGDVVVQIDVVLTTQFQFVFYEHRLKLITIIKVANSISDQRTLQSIHLMILINDRIVTKSSNLSLAHTATPKKSKKRFSHLRPHKALLEAI